MSQPEDPLQAALSVAFTPVSISPAPASSAQENESKSTAPSSGNNDDNTDEANSKSADAIPGSESEPSTRAAAQQPLVSEEARSRWEEERAALEVRWKRESAVQREEAEARRARIAAEYAALGKTWEKRNGETSLRGPPNPHFQVKDATDSASGSAGEPSGSSGSVCKVPHDASSPNAGGGTTLDHGQPWEEITDIPSMESSLPSLSFPEKSESASSPDFGTHKRSGERHHAYRDDKPSRPPRGSAGVGSSTPAPPPPSMTLSIFDSRLSTRSRVIAFFSALSINLLLPFVNGVMLGFGEIFARSLAVRFGWRIPGLHTVQAAAARVGGAAAAVGIRASNAASKRI